MNADFYPKAEYRLRVGTPKNGILELAKSMGVSEKDASDWYDARAKRVAERAAVTSGQEQVFSMLDSIIANGNPNLVVYRRGDNNEFYEYQDGVYVHRTRQDVRDIVDMAMCDNGLQTHRTVRRKVIDTVDRLASTLMRLNRSYSDERVAMQEWRINMKNGLFDPKTKVLYPHTTKYFSTSQVPFPYDPSAKIDKFQSFLDTVSEGDVSQQRMLQEMFGYCLIDGNPKHKVFYLYGTTARNGKSTTAKILMGLLGEKNCSSLSLAQLSNDGNRALQGLIGKQLNFSDEVSTKYIESSLLTSLSAEGVVHIDPKYKDSFDYHVKAKFIITCNDIPRFESSQGMLNRMCIIPFKHHFSEHERIERYDQILLEAEGGAILNWALEGMDILTKNGVFTTSDQSKEDLEEARRESNPVFAYLQDTFDFTNNNTDIIMTDSLYGMPRIPGGKEHGQLPSGYFLYCEESGIRPMSKMKFMKEVARFANATNKIERYRIKGDDGVNASRGYCRLQRKTDNF